MNSLATVAGAAHKKATAAISAAVARQSGIE